MFGIADRLGIDLGTANIVVFARKRGIVIREPSVVAVERRTRRVLAVGEEAREMLGRTPGNIVAMRPLRDGVIADYTITRDMLAHLIRRACGRPGRFFKPLVVICVPSASTSVEKRAALDAARSAGAREAIPIEEPMAAAIGAGLPIASPGGNMVVDIGGGTTDVAVISMFAVAYSESVRVAGDEANEAILRYMQRERQMIISEVLAENVKMKIGTAAPLDEPQSMEITGKEILTGIPRTFSVTDEEIREAIREPVTAIVESVKRALEKTPPDLASDIHEKGFWLAGGGALLKGLDRLLAQSTNLKVNIADDPLTAIVRGAGAVIEHLDYYRQVFIN